MSFVSEGVDSVDHSVDSGAYVGVADQAQHSEEDDLHEVHRG